MGTEAIWVPLVAAALGTGISVYNTNKTAERQDDAAAAGLRRQGKIQEEADRKVDEGLGELARSSMAEAREERLGQFMDQLLRNRGKGTGDEAAAAIGGDAFKRSSAESLGRADAAAQRTAGLLATADSAILQREKEGQGYGRLATSVNDVARRSRGQAFIDDLRARAIRRNAGLDVAAGLVSGAGQAYGANAGSGVAELAPYGEVTKQIPLEPVSIY